MILLVVFVIGLCASAPAPNTCGELGLGFAPTVAHGIHSLTVEDIRHYFKADAPVENNIPTVNKDLTGARVLSYAPLAGYDTHFETSAMQILDVILQKMDEPTWGLTHYTTLERITHAFHMAEMWTEAAEQYEKIAQIQDARSELCDCVRDVDSNGVKAYVELSAFKIRYPGITSGNETFTNRYLTERQKPEAAYIKTSLSYGKKELTPLYSRAALLEFDFNGEDYELLEKIATELVDGAEVMTSSLDSTEHWMKMWRETVTGGMAESGHYDQALFMFCMLN